MTGAAVAIPGKGDSAAVRAGDMSDFSVAPLTLLAPAATLRRGQRQAGLT